jgi:phage replication O-like protein O
MGESVLIPETKRFVRVPTELLEPLLLLPLRGTQWRVLFWVIRQSYGWNRQSTSFTWYRIAKELELNRAGVYRAGQALLAARLLVCDGGQLAVQTDPRLWNTDIFSVSRAARRQLWIPGLPVAWEQRPALPVDNDSVAGQQLNRCLKATLFRRAKDSKDIIKTYKKTAANGGVAGRPRFQNGADSEHPAGAAQPISGKYDGLSED